MEEREGTRKKSFHGVRKAWSLKVMQSVKRKHIEPLVKGRAEWVGTSIGSGTLIWRNLDTCNSFSQAMKPQQEMINPCKVYGSLGHKLEAEVSSWTLGHVLVQNWNQPLRHRIHFLPAPIRKRLQEEGHSTAASFKSPTHLQWKPAPQEECKRWSPAF